MDKEFFHITFEATLCLDASEGPRQNILEPKFQAREQMLQLRESISNAYKESKSFTAMQQYCQCTVFIGQNMQETDEIADGAQELCKAYTLALSGIKGELVESLCEVTPTDILEIISSEKHPLSPEKDFSFSLEYLLALNAIGLYLSNRDKELRLNEAKKVLVLAESAYKSWDKWFSSQPNHCTLKDIPVGDDGFMIRDKIPSENMETFRLRFSMDGAYTTTIFLLAQVYASLKKQALASRYCQLTLYYQLLGKKDFSKKAWATTALQLGGFYISVRNYEKAFYCFSAGQHMMPKDKPEDEETLGLVAWNFGKYHLSRIIFYGDILRGVMPQGPLSEDTDSTWVNFPLDIPPPAPQPHLETFEEAREEFKKANERFNEALKYYVYDGCCTDHIEITKDIARLYEALTVFEKDRNRIIAMHQRRITLIEKFPKDLSFNSYPTLVRQLWYDLGSISEVIVDLRIQQRSNPNKGEVPMDDKSFNRLIDNALGYYEKFCQTWEDPKTKQIPQKLDEDSSVPFFRALMSITHLKLKRAHKTPKLEHEAMDKIIDHLKKVILFAKMNSLNEECDKEVQLAKDLVELLPLKQLDIRRLIASV